MKIKYQDEMGLAKHINKLGIGKELGVSKYGAFRTNHGGYHG